MQFYDEFRAPLDTDEADSLRSAGVYPAVSAETSKPGFGGWVLRLIAAPAAVPLLALLLCGGEWLFGAGGPGYLAIGIALATASALAIAYLALRRLSTKQSLYIRQLEQAFERLQAQLGEYEHSSQIAQQAAEENRRTIWKVFKASPDPMAVLDAGPGGIFLAVNQAFATTFGYGRDEVLGKTPVELNMLAQPENLADVRRRLEPEGYMPDAETAFRANDGRIVWGLLSAVTVDVAGKPYVSWIVRDITDRKRMETELIAAREAAEAASRAKTEFLSSMSHEIRTPMNAVLGMAQLLAETELSEDQRHYLDLMVANGNSLLDLINSILDLAKIESGRMQVEQTEFDLSELVNKTLAALSVRAHSKKLELVARLAPGVPEHLVGDPLRLRQVLTNLLGNAIKFTDRGEVVLTAEPSAPLQEMLELQFSVADTGIGIAPDKLDSIFSNFTQADSSTTRKYGGSGLGLAIAHRLVALMDGQMSVESKLDGGSRFSFTARFGRAPNTNDSAVKSTISLAGCRVLIADDSAINRQVVREMLAETGAEIDEAANSSNALKSMRQAAEEGRPYQYVLLDVAMPTVDGIAVVWHLRSYHLPAKSLLPMLSSDELKQQITQLEQLGLATYLVKPVTRRDLFQAIRALNNAQQRDRILPDVPSDAQSPATLRILVAEDSPDNRLVMAAYLRREPYHIDFAEDGRQAFEKFIANPYDLVLMDIQMPQMDGLEASRAIRQWELEHARMPTPIVALTAYALEEDVQRALSAGCNLHVSKPLKKQGLIKCIQEATQVGSVNGLNRSSRSSPCYS
jgi:two-component system, sensor histidine kinase and response regulator